MIVVTGATGQLGRLVVRHLLRLVPAEQIAVVVRDPTRATHLAKHGVAVRTAEHDVPASLARAFGSGLAGSSLASAFGPPLRCSVRARMVLNAVTVCGPPNDG